VSDSLSPSPQKYSCALPIRFSARPSPSMSWASRAQGMGGAFTSIADDGSALYFNPAGIAFQKGLKLEMDMLAVVGLFRFTPSAASGRSFRPTATADRSSRTSFQWPTCI